MERPEPVTLTILPQMTSRKTKPNITQNQMVMVFSGLALDLGTGDVVGVIYSALEILSKNQSPLRIRKGTSERSRSFNPFTNYLLNIS